MHLSHTFLLKRLSIIYGKHHQNVYVDKSQLVLVEGSEFAGKSTLEEIVKNFISGGVFQTTQHRYGTKRSTGIA